MRFDIVVAGVGGQGVVAVATLIGTAAAREGLLIKQSEVHGMAQRGGSVLAHLRLADTPIWSDLIGRGGARLLIGLEPLEALRWLEYLAPDGTLVASLAPVRNLPAYPDETLLRERLRAHGPVVLIDAPHLATQAGLARASNTVLLGAAAQLLPLRRETLIAHLREAFAAHGPEVVAANLRAFRAGCEAAVLPF